MNMFRTLRADEIDCRISQIKQDSNGNVTGLSLLLYKDARCDQNILDETVGPMNWKREHTRDNRNCIVSVWDNEKAQWIGKEDTGTESNTEKEKGLASDSFKRACFNWGIGRELYTAPFIWIKPQDFKVTEFKGKKSCYDRFTVTGIGYKDGVITGLEIKNQNLNKVCYKWGKIQDHAPDKPEKPDDEPDEIKQEDVQVPPANATVTTIPELPEEAITPKQYINNEIVKMMKIFNISQKKMMISKFAEMKKILIEGKVIPDIKTEDQTMEQAEQMVKAIYDNFLPDGAVA